MKKEAKLCECGCGKKVKPGKRFVKGHWVRVNQPSKCPEVAKKISDSKNPAKRPEVGKKISKAKTGKTYEELYGVEETKKKKKHMSIVMNNEETKKKVSIKIKEKFKDKEWVVQWLKARLAVISVKPNKIEKQLNSVLQLILPNEYKINVKADIMVLGGKVPDFVNVNGKKKVIELYGDYWHRNDNPQNRIDYFKQFGWDTLVIWEHELKDERAVINRVLEFHGLPSQLCSKQLFFD